MRNLILPLILGLSFLSLSKTSSAQNQTDTLNLNPKGDYLEYYFGFQAVYVSFFEDDYGIPASFGGYVGYLLPNQIGVEFIMEGSPDLIQGQLAFGPDIPFSDKGRLALRFGLTFGEYWVSNRSDFSNPYYYYWDNYLGGSVSITVKSSHKHLQINPYLRYDSNNSLGASNDYSQAMYNFGVLSAGLRLNIGLMKRNGPTSLYY